MAPIYNLLKSQTYREKRLRYQKTGPVQIGIGERRRPDPQGQPGYLLNAVDEVTQWQVVGATAQIGEHWLSPVLEAILTQFPFRIRGFHSDNGSEFINHTVARLLTKLLVEQTKSRPRHSNDNGLVESKNGAVIRKHIGYGYIDAGHAAANHSFYRDHFNPYLNFHRPCGLPETITDRKGKQRRVYRRYVAPWELLWQIPKVTTFLKPGISSQQLQRVADTRSDTAAARAMQEQKRKLLAGLRQKRSA